MSEKKSVNFAPVKPSDTVPISSSTNGAPEKPQPQNGVTVRTSEGVERKHLFDPRPLTEQLRSLCDAFELTFDEDKNYYVLTQGLGPGAPLIRSEAQLQNLSPKVTLGLVKGTELVTARISALEVASTGEVAGRLRGLLAAIYGDMWVCDEVIERDGVGHVLRATRRDNSSAVTELAMACLCELFQYTGGQKAIEAQEAEVSPTIFKQLFSALFPPPERAGEIKAVRTAPRACLCAAHFFLSTMPGTSAAAHQAALGSDAARMQGNVVEGTWDPIYPRIVRALDSDETFQAAAAESLLAAMCSAASANSDNQLLQLIKSEVVTLGGEGEVDVEELLESEDRWGSFLIAVMGACSELASFRNSESVGSTDAEGMSIEMRRINQRSKSVHETNGKLKEQVRKKQDQMAAMMPFMKIESAPLVEKSLDGIVKSGWDSIHWKRNYNLLHYCAECIEDPSVVELVALFATDINQRDDNGCRPIDFARQSGHPGVRTVLERLRRQQRLGSKGRDQKGQGGPKGRNRSESGKDEPKPYVRNPQLEKRLADMNAEGTLDKSLSQAIKTVLEVGWENVEWPANYTAMHLAAHNGNCKAVDLLVDCNADLTQLDGWHLAPLDYALQAGSDDIIECIQKHIDKGPVQPVSSGGGVQAGGGGSGGSTPPKELSAEERKLLVVPAGLRPELQRACEAVLKKGWSKIKWPHDFTALHLAARLGSADVVNLLLKATAYPDLQKKDDKNHSPIDYAKEKNHPEIVRILTDAASCGSAGVGGNGSPGPSRRTAFSGAGTGDGGPGDFGSLHPELDGPLDGIGRSIKSGRAQTAAASLGISGGDFDLLQEKIKQRERDPEELGLQQLRAELEKLRRERSMWQQERTNLLSAGLGVGGPVVAVVVWVVPVVAVLAVVCPAVVVAVLVDLSMRPQ